MPDYTMIQANGGRQWNFKKYPVKKIENLVVFKNSIISHMEKTEQRKTIVRFYDNFPSEGGNELSVHEAFELIRKTVYFTIEYDNSSKGRENELVEDDDAAEGDDDALDEGGEDGDDEHEDDD